MLFIITIIVLGLLNGEPPPGTGRDSLSILFWNLENFFDWKDGGLSSSDAEFSPRGERHWTRRKFDAKCHAVAKTLLWCGEQAGRLPDVVGVAEVENAFVLRRLLEETLLRKLDYRIVHFDSPDRRGIDVALLYRSSVLELEEARAVPIRGTGPSAGGKGTDTLRSRDILLARLRTQSGKRVQVLVNHHPSKFGGGLTQWRREAAIDRLAALCDSLGKTGGDVIVAMGDFNDTPDNPSYEKLSEAGLDNLALPLSRKGQGTIRYQGRWELIDHFHVSRGARGAMTILHPPFLTERDNVHSGDRPMRTYIGPRYHGGVSDHRPILLELKL